jgi:formate-dependent nitrite reductase cytochrome c552 subunit
MTTPAPNPPPERPLKLAAYALGAALATVAFVAVIVPQAAGFHAKGPANTGHAMLACTDCHKQAPGTTRQQLQAKVQFWLGGRANDAAFGHERVGNAQCADCHAREQDSHPVHRFLEPRFAEARAALGADSCVSCHREHTGVRVTMPATACATCHQELALKRDPLDVSHHELVARKDWQTCLGCHDFHGNHKRVTQTRVDAAFSTSAIRDYLAGGSSPYGRDMKYPSKTGGQ